MIGFECSRYVQSVDVSTALDTWFQKTRIGVYSVPRMRQRHPLVESVVGLVGAAFLTAGLVSPWIQQNPSYHGDVPSVYLTGMRSGLQWSDYLLLGGRGVSLFCIFTRRYTTTTNRVIAATGGGAVLAVGINILSYLPAYAPIFVPTRGAYFTIVGGLLFSGIGLTRPHTGQNDTQDDPSGITELADNRHHARIAPDQSCHVQSVSWAMERGYRLGRFQYGDPADSQGVSVYPASPSCSSHPPA